MDSISFMSVVSLISLTSHRLPVCRINFIHGRFRLRSQEFSLYDKLKRYGNAVCEAVMVSDSFTETTDKQFGCFVAVGSGKDLKTGILFLLSDTDITNRDNNDIIHLTDTCYSQLLNS